MIFILDFIYLFLTLAYQNHKKIILKKYQFDSFSSKNNLKSELNRITKQSIKSKSNMIILIQP
jgi:hypothetical protein